MEMEAKENLKEATSNISQGTLRVLHCPHFISISGFQHGCMLGKFPYDCQSCDCPDKKYVDMNYTGTFVDTINTEKDMKEKELEEVIICACHSPEHQWVINTINGDDDVYVSYHLVKERWYKRIWYGIKYIFGYTCKFGHFDEMILTKEHLPKLRKIVKYLETNHNPIK